jgi:ribonuclease P protein component
LTEDLSYHFNKNEKLKSRKLTEQLFAKGDTFLVFPVKVLYIVVKEPLDYSIKIGVTASSKKFKKAVDRNRIKRILKEQYRLNKHPLHSYVNGKNLQVIVFFIYIDKVLPTKGLLDKKMPIIIDKLIKAIDEKISPAL